MKKYSIPMDKIREICEYNSLLDTVQSMRELKDFFSQKSVKGLYLKDILQEAGLNYYQSHCQFPFPYSPFPLFSSMNRFHQTPQS